MRSDTLTPMRLLALVLIVGACGGDLDLDVSVEHPADLEVATTTVTVYESTTLTCIDIAFARIGANELDAAKVAEEAVTSTGEHSGKLAGVSRTDHKVIVARGYSTGGAWITAGCAEQDVVADDTRVAITTAATVTAATVLDANADDPLLAVIATTDAFGRAITDRRVAWTVYGPAGSLPMAPANTASPSDGVWEPTRATCTGVSGAAALHPPPPAAVGGYAVQLRAEWATGLPAAYSRLIASFATQSLSPPTGATKFCAVRKAGSVSRVVCLDNGMARDYQVTLGGGQPSLIARDATPIGPEAKHLVSVPNGTDLDVYVMSTRGLLAPLFGAPMPDNSAAPCADGSCEVDDVIAVPACGSQPGKLVVRLAATGSGQLKQMNARGGGTQDFPLGTIAANAQIQLDNAGCVTRADPGGASPTLRQVVTYHVGTRNALGELVPLASRAAYGCSTSTCLMNELLPGAGVTFTTGAEPRMIATSVDATGVVLIEVIMAPDTPMRDLFVERARIPSAGIPDRLVTGRYDADDERDLFWNIGARRGTTFEIAYGRTVGGLPLAAVSTPQAIVLTSLMSADVTSDGFDDLIGIGQVGSVSALIVIPANAPAPPITVPVDSTCS